MELSIQALPTFPGWGGDEKTGPTIHLHMLSICVDFSCTGIH
jgi:hypothetical protein